ncbi:hypothetical protein [Enterovibrio paralichthyis]|uniref:hypothetical protein n=1 Tax=Enterovibrio paralichthyis TaxID=2853805 RepID=UPI001C46F458|nr:hypothetical protein [Enterovibrio paralichthyis]MBV7300263.1 hypothetical protein [Enterovibrio paralichthyis]
MKSTSNFVPVVVYLQERKVFFVGLRNVEDGTVLHALSYTQRAATGRTPEVKTFNSFPIQALNQVNVNECVMLIC